MKATRGSRFLRRQAPLAIAGLLGGSVLAVVGGPVNVVGADAPYPSGVTEVSVVFDDQGTPDTADDTYTVTASGTWGWQRTKDCNIDRYGTGWEVDWDDATQPGNPIGTTGVDVGALEANAYNPADNTVDYTATEPRCGSGNAGAWGPISHTYAATTDLAALNMCVVTYDLHFGDSTKTTVKPTDLNAGGDAHNRDNGVEANANQPGGNQCMPIPFDMPTGTLTLHKVIDNTGGGTAVLSDFTLTATEVGGDGESVEGVDGASGSVTGEFALSETDNPDYDASLWECGDASVVDGVVTVRSGESVDCTITNTYDGSGSQPPPPPTTLPKEIPETGGNSGTAALWGSVLALTGVTAMAIGRRRRHHHAA